MDEIRQLTLADLLRSESVTTDMLAYLWTLLDAKASGLVVGTTGTGKTTVANALLTLVNSKWNVAVLESSPELSIPHGLTTYYRLPHNFSARLADGSMREHTITENCVLKKLIVPPLRPDFAVLGESRGNEMKSLLVAAGTGIGCITTYHAGSATGSLERMHSSGITEDDLGALWFIMLCDVVDGKRVVTDVTEVFHSDGKLETNQIFRYDGQACLQVSDNLIDTARYAEACNAAGIKEPEHDFAFRKHVLEKVKTKMMTQEAAFDMIQACNKPNRSG